MLADFCALEQLLESGRIESGVRRIRAEQEMFLVDRKRCPAPVAIEVLEEICDPRLTTEIGKFNLEANLSLLVLNGRCQREMEREIEEIICLTRRGANQHGSEVLLAGTASRLWGNSCRPIFLPCGQTISSIFAASVMDWKHVRHVPVEDNEGRLFGIISHRDLLRLMARDSLHRGGKMITVRGIMTPHPVSDLPSC